MFAGSVFVTREGGIVCSLFGRPEGGTAGKARVIRETLVGGTPRDVSGEDPSSARVSRFFGNDPAKWIRDIRAWDTVRLDHVYEGVDVRLKARGGSVEKVFHVGPGADPSAIRLRLEGSDRLAVNDRGELEVHAGGETVRFTAPVAWQEDDGGMKIPVTASYEVAGNEYGFRLAGYDPGREIVIDPLLAATYLGGSASPTTARDAAYDDQPYAMDFDATGNLYVVGATLSSNFPPGAGFNNTGMADAFVVKLSSDLTQILAATFLGGLDDEIATSVKVRNNFVYVAGSTKSRDDFPTVQGGYIQRGYDWGAFVVRFDLPLSTLSAGAILGGTFADNEVSMSMDNPGNVYIAGRTMSYDFPSTPGAFDNSFNGVLDVFVRRYSGDLATLQYSTFLFLGSTSTNTPRTFLTLDGTGNVYVASITNYPSILTTAGAARENFNHPYSFYYYDGFIAKFDATLSADTAPPHCVNRFSLRHRDRCSRG